MKREAIEMPFDVFRALCRTPEQCDNRENRRSEEMTGLDPDSLQKVRDTIVELLSMRYNTRRMKKIKHRCKELVLSNPNLARMCCYYLKRKKENMRSLNLGFDEEEGVLLRLLTEMLDLTKFT